MDDHNPFVAHHTMAKERAKTRKKSIEEPNTIIIDDEKVIFCEKCGLQIIDDHYFQCRYHQTIFCDSCVKNKYQPQFKRSDSAHCSFIDKVRSKNMKDDCIYEMKNINIPPIKKSKLQNE